MAKPILARLGVRLEELPRARDKARASGSKWFFTGRPCKRGHLAARLVSSATCMECHRNRVAADYAKNPEPTKRNAIKRMREMRRDDPERAKAIGRNAMRAWRGENRDRHLANDRAWREANRETINAQRRERYDSDPDKFRAKVKRWRKRYPEKARDRFRVWCKANPDKTRVRHRNRRARKRNAEGRHAAEDIARIRVAQNDLCVFCEIELHGKGHVDHKIPLARGGSNWPSNLQILCGSCNLSKGAKLPDEMVFPMPGV